MCSSSDAIENGILEQYLDLSDEDIENFHTYLNNITKTDDYQEFDMSDLVDFIMDDNFEIVLRQLFDYLKNEQQPQNIPITGETDDYQEFDLEYNS